ncbi:tyrosine-type recombinase/integrase [Nostoc sp. KVJ3]|uniref:site-specific integrase n=1 Tax=Nostoc sp. KVJ3 TaxID=457945 RepID=UPI002237DCFD|nr:site-specific integrase [Nostoc sp. KVJ3]MCW5317907.1 tyrosine-type recombinase/integrase [Nostoc sp. KVJ3]
MKELKVRKNGKKCLLRWTHRDEDYSLTWGHWDNPEEKARLSYCGKLIYQDCLIGEFDTALTKYNLWLQGIIYSGNGGGVKPAESRFPPLIQMLEQRIEDRYNSADIGLLGSLKAYKKLIKTSADAKAFMKWLTEVRKLAPSSKKRYLAVLQVIRKDLFGEIKVRVGEKPKAKPFTKVEVAQILNHLKEDRHYSHYYDFILLLFNTGTRTSEAIGLLWRDVDLVKRELHIYETLGRYKGKTNVRERRTTKNTKYRIVPINNAVYKMLVRRPKGRVEDLVFTSPTGLCIDDHNVSQRCWKITLKTLGIAHRNLYQTRHTFASHCIDSGMTIQETAAITGHSIKMLYEHYLGSVKRPVLPEL